MRSLGYTQLADDAEQRLDRSPEGTYREVDPSTLHRVVVDPLADEEVLIHGQSDATFRKAVLEYWNFSRVDRKSGWRIMDERGNDISDSPLSSFSGVATIVAGGETRSVTTDWEEETYSTMDSGVEYYE